MAGLVFAVSAALLAFEILLLRVFAVQHFHHFAYAVIAIAMLGGGAAGTLLVLLRAAVSGRERRLALGAAAAFAALLVAGPAVARVLPFEPTALVWSARAWLDLALVTLVLATPFFAGTAAVILAVLADPPRTPALYGASLAGSAAGAALAPALLALAPPWRPPVSPYKALPQVEAFAGAVRTDERWGPLGWVVAVRAPAFHYAPGLSLAFRGALPPQSALFVDGELAGATTAWRGEAAGVEFLDWTPAASAYRVATPRRVLVLGAGGGLDVLGALNHGAGRVVAVELDRNVVAVARRQLDAASDVYGDARVTLEIGDARAFLERSDERFDVILLSPGEAFGSAAAGLKALGEDYLATVEAVRAALRHLAPRGVFAVTRWVRAPPRDDVRMALTVAAALRGTGDAAPGGRVAVLRNWSASTVLVRPDGFGEAERSALRAFAASRLLDVDWLGGEPPPDVPVFNRQARAAARDAARAAAASPAEAAAFAASYAFDVRPATDDRPYASHFLRLRTLRRLLALGGPAWLPFAEWGYVAVLATLLVGAAAGTLAMLGPAALLARRARGAGASAATVACYFGAIGLGYLAVEMAFIQQFQRLLGHPVLAVSAALAGFLACSGAGSLWSARWAPGWRAPALAGLLLGLAALAVPQAVSAAQSLPLLARAAVGAALLAPPAIVMGFPFPGGLRTLAAGRPGLVAWAWAANGFASVVAASAATAVAVEAGWRWVLAGGALCYAVAAAASYRPRQIFHRPSTSSPRTTS